LSALSSLRPGLGRYDLSGAARGEASVSGWFGEFEVAKAELLVKDFKASLAGPAKVSAEELDLAAVEGFSRLSLALAGGSLRAVSEDFGEVSLATELAGEDLRVSRLSFKWRDSTVRLKARVRELSKPKEVSISGSVDRVGWEDAEELVEHIRAAISTRAASAEDEAAAKKTWVSAFKVLIPRKLPDTVGHVHIGLVTHKNASFGDSDLLWDLRGVTPSLREVNGEVRVGFGPGRVSDIQAVQSASKILRILFLPYVYMYKMNRLSVLSAATAYPTSFDFNRIEGQYAISRGAVTTRFFHVDGPSLVAYADGTADFVNETVDMNVLTRLTSYRAALPDWWQDEAGRPAIGFRVKGNLNQPDLEPRLHKMASDEIEKTLAEARRKAEGRFEAIEKLKTL
jgi:uncharacterized protein YhdP